MSKIHQSEDRLSEFVKNAPDAIFCLGFERNEQGQPHSFYVTDVNNSGARFLNRPSGEISGQLLLDLIEPARAQALIPRLEAVVSADRAMEFEEDIENAGEHQYVQLQIVPASQGLLVHARDVSHDRVAHQTLWNSQDYIQSVIDNAPIIIYELGRDGVFKLSAGKSLAVIGLSPNEAVGASIYDFFDEGSSEVAAFQSALNGETVSTETNLGDGYFTSRYTPRYDLDGSIVGVLGVSYDITDRKKAEEQLQQAQKMEVVGQLTGGVAHDFNNLLAVIMGNLDLLVLQPDLDDGSRELADNAIAATHRGALLTQRLLAFSRRQLLDPRPTDANALIENMLLLLGRTLPETIFIKFEPSSGLWQAQIDPSQLENAILNLCVNARDAMPEGGTLSITTKNVAISSQVNEIEGISPGNYVEIAVRDTGLGIPEAIRNRIFEPFFTTKEVGTGSGLGLSMVYGFVDQSGGAVQVESEPEKGSQIRLLLPQANKGVQTLEREQDTHNLAKGNGEEILLVEDDENVRQFVKLALESMNYLVIEAQDAAAAIALLKQRSTIKVLFSDIVLPGGMSGIDLTSQATNLLPHLKVMLTTGYSNHQFESGSVVETIAKPYRIVDLSRKLHKLLNE